jgi:hypothetical protein
MWFMMNLLLVPLGSYWGRASDLRVVVSISMFEWDLNMFCDCTTRMGMIHVHTANEVVIRKLLDLLGRDPRLCVPAHDVAKSRKHLCWTTKNQPCLKLNRLESRLQIPNDRTIFLPLSFVKVLWKFGKVQMFSNDVNKSEFHSRGIKSKLQNSGNAFYHAVRNVTFPSAI